MSTFKLILAAVILLPTLRWLISIAVLFLLYAYEERKTSRDSMLWIYPEDRISHAHLKADRSYKRLMPWLCDLSR
jgi:hypothetical protein